MRSRLFNLYAKKSATKAQLDKTQPNKTRLDKTQLEMVIEWQHRFSDKLIEQIIATHVTSFLDLYKNYSAEQLGLKPGVTKKEWLTNMICEELAEVQTGKIYLATLHFQDNLVGFITCMPIKARGEDLKTDVYVSLLAVKPLYYFDLKALKILRAASQELTVKSAPISDEKIHVGFGKALVKSAMARFPKANTMTLDTRLINTDAIAFYQKLGFITTGTKTFGGANPAYYTGCERALQRRPSF